MKHIGLPENVCAVKPAQGSNAVDTEPAPYGSFPPLNGPFSGPFDFHHTQTWAAAAESLSQLKQTCLKRGLLHQLRPAPSSTVTRAPSLRFPFPACFLCLGVKSFWQKGTCKCVEGYVWSRVCVCVCWSIHLSVSFMTGSLPWHCGLLPSKCTHTHTRHVWMYTLFMCVSVLFCLVYMSLEVFPGRVKHIRDDERRNLVLWVTKINGSLWPPSKLQSLTLTK